MVVPNFVSASDGFAAAAWVLPISSAGTALVVPATVALVVVVPAAVASFPGAFTSAARGCTAGAAVAKANIPDILNANNIPIKSLN